jgi:cytochrome c-type biogenesis protein CcmH
MIRTRPDRGEGRWAPGLRRCAAAMSLAALLNALAMGVGGAWLLPGTARALDRYGQLEDPALQVRFERIAHDLRCLVCQNESIADSNAELASDLRRQVREMLVAGKSDDAIFAFMTDRYGEFVRFNPPLEPKTLLIWGAPFIMLVMGGIIIYRVTRQRSRLPLDDEPS